MLTEKIRGGDLTSIKDSVAQDVSGFLDYIKERNEKLIIATQRDISSRHETCKGFRKEKTRRTGGGSQTKTRSGYEGDGWNSE